MKRVYLLSESDKQEYLKNLPEMCVIAEPGFTETKDFDEDVMRLVKISSLEICVVKDDDDNHYVCVSDIPGVLSWMRYANELWYVFSECDDSFICDETSIGLDGYTDLSGGNVAFVSTYTNEEHYRLLNPVFSENALVRLLKPWNDHKKGSIVLVRPEDWRDKDTRRLMFTILKPNETLVSTCDLDVLSCYNLTVENTTPYVLLIGND